MRRFYVSPQALNRNPVLLDRDESHHLVRVLRMTPGDPVELFDGSGALYTGTIAHLGDQVALSSPLSRIEPSGEQNSGSVVVCQADLKGGKMDFLVEKCTELGVDRFIPFKAGRSQGRPDRRRLTQRQQRRLAIVTKACKQSGRLRFMRVDQDMSFTDLLETQFDPSFRKLLLWERAGTRRLTEIIDARKGDPVCLMVGPEGGFSDQEAALARSFGWQTAGLGELILRAETATISAVAIVNNLLGRM